MPNNGHHGLFTNSKTFYNYMHKVKNIVVLSQSMLTQIVKAFTVKLVDSDTHSRRDRHGTNTNSESVGRHIWLGG